MNRDQIIDTRSLLIIEGKYVFATLACLVVAVLVLLAAAAKIATIVDLDGERQLSDKECPPRILHVSSESTQTERNLQGSLHNDEGLTVENENGSLYFVEEQTGTRYGPVSWRDLHSRVASGALSRIDNSAGTDETFSEVVVEKAAQHSLLRSTV